MTQAFFNFDPLDKTDWPPDYSKMSKEDREWHEMMDKKNSQETANLADAWILEKINKMMNPPEEAAVWDADKWRILTRTMQEEMDSIYKATNDGPFWCMVHTKELADETLKVVQEQMPNTKFSLINSFDDVWKIREIPRKLKAECIAEKIPRSCLSLEEEKQMTEELREKPSEELMGNRNHS